jgi:hypothetical protein
MKEEADQLPAGLLPTGTWTDTNNVLFFLAPPVGRALEFRVVVQIVRSPPHPKEQRANIVNLEVVQHP